MPTTKTAKGWKKDGISTTVKHSDKILDLFNNCSVQFRLDNIMNTPTSRIVAVHATPQTIVVVDHWNANVRDYTQTITSYQQLFIYQVCVFSGWFMGDEISTLAKSSDMNIISIGPNEDGNLGLVDR